MKRYLKNYVLTIGDVEASIYDCLKHKWRRKDVSYFLAEYMKKDGDDIHKVARYCRKIAYHKQTRYLLYDTISQAAVRLYEEIPLVVYVSWNADIYITAWKIQQIKRLL